MNKILFYLFCLGFILKSPVLGLETITYVKSISIKMNDCDEKEKYTQIVNDILPFNINDTFNATFLTTATHVFYRSNFFERVMIDTMRDADGMNLSVNLITANYIKNIHIYNEYPLLESDIKKYLSISSGDLYVKSEVEKQKAYIIEYLKNEGYKSPAINVEVKADSKGQNKIVCFTIYKGKYDKLDELKIVGNNSFSDLKIRRKCKSWLKRRLPGNLGRFIHKDLKNDLNELIKYYRGKGFADITIDFSLKQIDNSCKQKLVIDINEGKKYEVSFSKTKLIKRKDIKKCNVIHINGNQNNRGIRKTEKNIKKLFQVSGLLNHRVATLVSSDSLDTTITRIQFDISERKKTIVTDLVFNGDIEYSKKELKKYILTTTKKMFNLGVFNPQIFSEDIVSLKSFYFSKGYLNAKIIDSLVWSSDSSSLSIIIFIQKNILTKIRKIDIAFSDSSAIPDDDIPAIKNIVNMPLLYNAVYTDANNLSSFYANKGYPFVNIKTDILFTKDSSGAVIAYNVDIGKHVFTGNTYVTGNYRSRMKLFNRSIVLDTFFTLKALLKSEQKLRDLSCLNSIKIIPTGLIEKQDSIHIFIKAIEKKALFIKLGGGYRSDKGGYGKIRVGNRNLFGLNRSLWLEYAGAIVELNPSKFGYSFNPGLDMPSIFNTNFNAGINVIYAKRPERGKRFGVNIFSPSLMLNRKWKYAQFTLASKYDVVELYITDESVADTNSYDTLRNMVIVTPTLQFDFRDSPVRPRKGFYTSISIDVSKGIKSFSDDFFRLQIDGRYYYTPIKPWTFASRIKIGHLQPYGRGIFAPTEDQLFFLGGTSTVRGYKENMLHNDINNNAFGNNNSLLFSIESRLEFLKNIEWTLFWDGGNISGSLLNLFRDGLKYGVGTGFRYHTVIGPVGLLYGYKLNDWNSKKYWGRLHFSIGYTF